MTQARPREASHLGGPERNILYLIFWLKISPLNLDFGSVVTNQCSIKLTNVFKCEVFRIKRSKTVTKRVKWVIPITGLQLIARAAGNAKILVALYWSSMCCAGLCLVFTQVAHWFDLLSDKIYSYIAKPCPLPPLIQIVILTQSRLTWPRLPSMERTEINVLIAVKSVREA